MAASTRWPFGAYGVRALPQIQGLQRTVMELQLATGEESGMTSRAKRHDTALVETRRRLEEERRLIQGEFCATREQKSDKPPGRIRMNSKAAQRQLVRVVRDTFMRQSRPVTAQGPPSRSRSRARSRSRSGSSRGVSSSSSSSSSRSASR
jgi:hypothetical protein